MARVGGVFSCVALAMLALVVTSAAAQDYPAKPVRMIVPFAPGTTTDGAARVTASGMAKSLGQPVVIDSRPGGGGMPALEFVAKQAAADGYTLLFTDGGALVTLPLFVKELTFEPLRDLPPISLTVEGVSVVFSPMAAPWTNYKEFVAYVQANPGRINYGSALYGQSRLSLEIVRQKNNLNMVFIAYKGGTSQTTPAILANEIQFSLAGSTVETLALDKKIRPLAIIGPRRLAKLPDVPTFTELGVPELPNGFGFVLNARAGTPRPVVAKVHAATVSALKLPEATEQFTKLNVYANPTTPDEALKILTDKANLYAQVAKRANIQPE